MVLELPALTALNVAAIQANLLNIIVSLVWGLVLLVIGYFAAVLIETVIRKAFEKIEVEKRMKEKKLDDALMGFTLTGLIGGLVKWIVFLWFLVSAVSIVESAFLVARPGAIPVLTNFLTDFVKFLPVLLQGILILVIGFLLADYLSAKMREGLKTQAKTVAAAVKVLVIYFTITIALSNPAYGINIGIITTIFNYLVLAVAVGLGGGIALALGLGLKDSIAHVAKKHESALERSLTGKMKR